MVISSSQNNQFFFSAVCKFCPQEICYYVSGCNLRCPRGVCKILLISQTDCWSAMGILFCIVFLTMGSMLYTFWGLHLWTLHNYSHAYGWKNGWQMRDNKLVPQNLYDMRDRCTFFLETDLSYESLNANLRLILFTWVSKWKGDP